MFTNFIIHNSFFNSHTNLFYI
jgi:hypothetical protein